MATLSSISLDVKDYGVETFVPDDDVARLMYYLHCITVGVGLSILQDDLVRYKEYNLLTPTRVDVVYKTALELDPEELINMLIFLDDEGEITEDSPNAFVSISTACNVVSVQSDIIIAGKSQKVTKVMFCTSAWLKEFYVDPLQRMAQTNFGSKHCSHCDGKDRICSCIKCTRGPESQCQTFLDAFFDALIPPPASSNSTSNHGSGTTPQPAPDDHQCCCDGCGWELFTGSRYQCSVCESYNLCSTCYRGDVHDTHPFMQINTPGARPTYLSVRRESAVDNHPSPDTMDDGISSSAYSPFFCTNMSVFELKEFLKDNGVYFGDAHDKETLSRRAWDTYCDSMSVFELDTFLSDNNISTASSTDLNSRRQRAKDSFLRPAMPSKPPGSHESSSPWLRKDDSVVLTGLTRAGMNGKTGKVVSIDHAEGKALVRVHAFNKTFKIKLGNLQLRDDELEELE